MAISPKCQFRDFISLVFCLNEVQQVNWMLRWISYVGKMLNACFIAASKGYVCISLNVGPVVINSLGKIRDEVFILI